MVRRLLTLHPRDNHDDRDDLKYTIIQTATILYHYIFTAHRAEREDL